MDEDLKYHVCFNEGTEPPFSGDYVNHKEKGTYTCTICNTALFKSETKFDSGTGWPSFYDAITNHIGTKVDTRHGINRTEIHCKNCASHLGHVFPDGPKPTNQRYCVNSISLNFIKEDPI